MPLINCDINFDLTWSIICIITNSTGVGTFVITDITKLWQQLKSGFKRAIMWNKYLLKKSIERRNPYLDYLVDASF